MLGRKLTFWVLVRAVDVVASCYHHRQFEALPVRIHQHLGGGLTGGIWVGRREDTGLHEVFAVLVDFTIHFVGRDVDEAPNLSGFSTLQHNVGAVNVGGREAIGVAKTQIDMRLRSEVEDGVNLVLIETCGDIGRARHVSLEEGEVWLRVENMMVVQSCTIVQLVETDDVVLRIGQNKMADQPRPTVRLDR